MSDVIGRGVIEVSADSRKLTAGIDEAKRSLKSLGIAAGDATKGQSQSIDRYVKSLGMAAVTSGKTARELELYKLALRGANAEQLKAADSALRMSEAYARGEQIGRQIKTGLLAIGVAATTGLIAAFVAFDQLTKKAGDFQDMAEKTGDTAQNIASLAVAAGTAGVGMETIVSASAKLTKGLTGVDDESKAAGSAIAALGLNIKDFKALAPADQMEAVAKALDGFKDGAQKTAVAMALFGKSGADLLPFLKELGAEGGRQVILTQAQIVQADAYADRQAKLRTELSLHAQAIASQMVPAYNLFTESLVDVAKEILGVQNGIAGMTKGDEIKRFAQDGAILLANIADIAYDVAGAFRFVGNNLGAMAAIAMANARLDFAGAIAIGAASDEQNARILKGLGLADKVQAKIDAMNRPKATGFVDQRLLGSVGTIAEQDAAMNPKKTLAFNGVDPKSTGKDTAGKEAKAKLDLDLERIKNNSGKLISAYTNGEKIMEALHSAGLMSESEYYASKLEFLRVNDTEQEKSLKSEIARMEMENLTGAEKTKNQKRIEEATAKLVKLQADSATATTLLGIQSTAAMDKVAQSYRDARDSAQDYLNTLIKATDAEKAGFGKGDKERGRISGRLQIEDKYTTQRQSLDKSKRDAEFSGTFGPDAKLKYDNELGLIKEFQGKALVEFDKGYADRLASEQNWATGAGDALANYSDSIANVAKSTEALFTDAFKGMEDALVEFTKTGTLDFSKMTDSIISDLMRMAIQSYVTGPIASMLGMSSIFGGARAAGGPVSAGKLYQVNEKGPELLNVAGKQYLMTGSQSGSVTPNGGGAGSQQNVTVIQNFTVGDVASISMVRQAVASSEKRIAGAMGRSMSYGGALS